MLVRCVAAWMLAGLSLTAQTPVGPGKGVNFYSLEKEAALGRQLAEDLRQRTAPIDSPMVREYLDRVSQQLAVPMEDAKLPFAVSAIADDLCPTIHEPAALPGGPIFVPAGLFLAARDEAEFAGMLAHAMEHIALRHGTRQATRGQIVNHASIPLIFMSGWGGCSERLAIPLGFLASQRSFELQADFHAVSSLARAGFDPKALVRYIERVQAPPTGTSLKMYSPLPDRDQRVTALLAAIEKLPPGDYAARPPEEFAAVQQEVRRHAETAVRRKTPPSLLRKTPE